MTTYASSDMHSLGSGPGRGPFTYSCPFGCDLGAPGCIRVSILPQTPFQSRLPCNIEQSSLCCAKGPCLLSTGNIAVGTCASQIP